MSFVLLWNLVSIKFLKGKKVLNISDYNSCENQRWDVGELFKLLSMSVGNADSIPSTFCFLAARELVDVHQ